ncbi:MAG: cob(I)yrinic acid a,c-diamide adenosyltransferase [Holophagaceae bacterium]|nr:cob(I)yrinic acid a,c-diamide adenosyltransferase [Holophagaceae bacterium]
MALYTHTGDGGETSLIGGQRVSKAHPRLEAYGTLDELNSLLGVLRLHVSKQLDVGGLLVAVQKDLFKLGNALADPSTSPDFKAPLMCPIEDMEADIDRLTAAAPKIQTFVLPSGCPASAFAHHARTVCRRAEREVVAMSHEAPVPEWIEAYLNRLGDWLFALARAENALEKTEEWL